MKVLIYKILNNIFSIHTFFQIHFFLSDDSYTHLQETYYCKKILLLNQI